MSSSYFSDDEATIVASDAASVNDQVARVIKVAKKECSVESITIIVTDLLLKPLKEELWPSKKKRGVTSLNGTIHLTTSENLQQTIDSLKVSRKQQVLNLLASLEIEGISFDVPSGFSTLKVLRCASKKDNKTLFIDGSSTYHDIRLEKWEAHQHKKHKLIIGYQPRVRIKLSGISNFRSWAQSRNDFTNTEREELRQNFGGLSSRSLWEDVKGKIAVILGIVVGGTKFSMGVTGAAGGIYAKYAFGLHAFEVGLGGAKFSAYTTAAGSAVVLGVTAAAAVYFIPWDSLFDWLKSALFWLWDQICELWGRFTSWVKSFFATNRLEKDGGYAPKPMGFSSHQC